MNTPMSQGDHLGVGHLPDSPRRVSAWRDDSYLCFGHSKWRDLATQSASASLRKTAQIKGNDSCRAEVATRRATLSVHS
jgi:hypothetical protein